MKRALVFAAAGRNWPGVVSIVLAVTSVVMYWLGTFPPDPNSAGGLGVLSFSMFQVCAATSALVGFLAVRRARGGGGGLVTAIIGLALGGTLTFLWVAWIGGLMLNPGAMGG